MRVALCLLCWGMAAAAPADEVGLLELFNYVEYSPRLMSSGQPTREQFADIAAAGIEAVINLAPVTDPGALADEQDIVTALGMDYTHIPVDWDEPPVGDVERFFEAMARFAGKRVLVHCYANARGSAFVYLWRTLRAGHDEREAHALMVEVWDWNEGYEFRNVAQWQQLVAAAQAALAQ